MPYKAFVLTSSDSGYAGERQDLSGPLAMELLRAAGWEIAGYALLPDDRDMLADKLREVCDSGEAQLLITTGGTGFSPRDNTPEATIAVCQRLCPGIPEAMRAESLRITPMGCLSRETAGIRGNTLIINLPGSKKAATENFSAVIRAVGHGLAVLRGDSGDCAGLHKGGDGHG